MVVAADSAALDSVYDRKSGFRLKSFWSSRLTMTAGAEAGEV